MKVLFFCLALAVNRAFAVQWVDYDAFEVDATNAIANIGILMSDGYTNRLHLCRGELDATNEMASAALLMLAMSDDAKSNCVKEFIGNTNAISAEKAGLKQQFESYSSLLPVETRAFLAKEHW